MNVGDTVYFINSWHISVVFPLKWIYKDKEKPDLKPVEYVSYLLSYHHS